jgi:hypothetical protein
MSPGLARNTPSAPRTFKPLNQQASLVITNDNGAVATVQHRGFRKGKALCAGCL